MLLLEFYKPDCVYCDKMNLMIDSMAKDFKKKYTVKKINTNESMALSQLFNIKSVPTLVLMHNGKELKRSIGAINKNEIKDFLQLS